MPAISDCLVDICQEERNYFLKFLSTHNIDPTQVVANAEIKFNTSQGDILRTPLMCAAELGLKEVTEALVKRLNVADVNHEIDGKTAIYIAFETIARVNMTDLILDKERHIAFLNNQFLLIDAFGPKAIKPAVGPHLAAIVDSYYEEHSLTPNLCCVVS